MGMVRIEPYLVEKVASPGNFDRKILTEESVALGPVNFTSWSSTSGAGRPAKASSFPATASSLSSGTVQNVLHSLPVSQASRHPDGH